MSDRFDLVVIGAGMAAVSAASKCAAAGWSVAVVDELPYGGTCALRGCDPKKILRRGAEIVEAARLMRGNGIDDAGLRVDWGELVAFKRRFTDATPPRIEDGLRRNGVTTLHGTARFTGPDSVEVAGRRLEARHFLIATGARPRPLAVPGAGHLTDSTRFMELDALPRRIVFIGGGYISFEFAHMAARAGAEVTILHRAPRPLKAFDPELVDRLVQRSTSAGIDIRLGTTLEAVEPAGEGFVVRARRNGEDCRWTADLVVHGAGRIPALEHLDLDAAGVAYGERGVTVSASLQSVSNPAVFAAGDAADTPGAPLTPVAVAEGKVAAGNMLRGERREPDYGGVPSVVFTLPELARVGLLESEARERGRELRVRFTDTGGWYSNLRVGEPCAAAKVLIDEATDEILGAHLLGPEYAELVNLFALAIKLGLKAGDLKRMPAAYPTVGSDLGSLL